MFAAPDTFGIASRLQGAARLTARLALGVVLLLPLGVRTQEAGWSVGFYAGQYYDTEPAGIIKGDASFLPQYLVALTASRPVWRSERWPLSLEIDIVLGQQFGLASLTEVAAAPALRWSGFPWNDSLPTALRVAPLGISHTSSVSPLERGVNNAGDHTLNFLLIELAFAAPQQRDHEFFVRLHHRCTIYDLLNNYGANGEDFLTFGFRRPF
ncbi:MAG: hypothetical protein OEY75_10320 [Hylemonella sp.]|nr:hypothetical protein [Hylemonella sp.]